MNYPQQVFQCYNSPVMEHFAPNLRSRWNLSPYSDRNEPTVMFGHYRPPDNSFLRNHRGPIIMIWGGADMTGNKAINLHNRPNSYQHGYGWISATLSKWNVKHKVFNLPLRSYDNFKPTPLGDKIYVYKGWLRDRGPYFMWDKWIVPLMKALGEDRFIHGMGHSHEYVHEHFYQNSFLYIKPNNRGGSTSMWELAHMGRKTVANGQGNAPNTIGFKNIQDILKIIESESSKIGTIQNQVAIDTHNHFMHDSCWLNLDWWKHER